MIAQNARLTNLSIPRTLKVIGVSGGIIGILGIILPVIAYAPGHPGFLPFTTYLSDMGATPVWPQILFNTGMLLNSPMRYLFLVLLVLRLTQLGVGRGFGWVALIVGAISTSGTIIMSSVPYSLDATIHEIGIPIYFFGVVILQMLIGTCEWKLKAVPRILPSLCFAVLATYSVFFILVMLYESGNVSRTTPIIWEWLCAIFVLVWLFAHSLILGREGLVGDQLEVCEGCRDGLLANA
jgi:hypothetical membrane protein